ncbi:MAG: leucine-rich repeat domain-containing protein [Lachnospiraceae bacterium]|nr:leucine-rich repeat domain-containing protein [Lachnospiraceae bacterium]
MSFEIEDGVLKKYIQEEGIKDVVVPDGISVIESWAFYRCKEIETFSMPNSVVRIGQSAFKWCSNMKEIKFSESLAHIEACAFEECRDLSSIIIPQGIKESVMEMGNIVFANCEELTSIKLSTNMDQIGDQFFTVVIPNYACLWKKNVLLQNILGDIRLNV